MYVCVCVCLFVCVCVCVALSFDLGLRLMHRLAEAQEQDRRPLGDRKQYLQFKLETRDFTGDLHAKLSHLRWRPQTPLCGHE